MSVTSKVGKGSCFSVFLPATREKVTQHLPVRKPETRSEGRVLIMDDEPEIREALGELLEEWDYHTSGAPDGEAALELYRQSREQGTPFDVVIMDLTIPGGMGGKEAIRRLLAIDPQARAIVYSGYSKDPVLASFRDHGFQAMLPKPFQLDQIANVLAKLVGDKSAHPPL